MSARVTRRAALAGAVGAALAPAVALAGSDEGAVAVELWRREAAAELAYRAQRGAFAGAETLQAHSGMHVSALSTLLAALGVPFPGKPDRPAQYADPAARLLFSASGDAVLPRAIRLEHGLVRAYRAALPVPTDLKVAVTLGTILASHAQHELMLRAEHGLEPLPAEQAAG